MTPQTCCRISERGHAKVGYAGSRWLELRAAVRRGRHVFVTCGRQGCRVTTTFSFEVKVIDGEGLPVPSVEVGVRYRYESGPRTWGSENTNGDGIASFRDAHPATVPVKVALFVEDQDCGWHPVTEGVHITLEM